MRHAARYYDGNTAVARMVTVLLDVEGLRILFAEGGGAFWPYADMRIPARPEAGRPLIIALRGAADARLALEDASLYHALAGRVPKGHAPRFTVSLSARSLLGWFAAAAASCAVFYFTAPMLAEPVARRIPPAWQDALGDYTESAFTSGKRACTQAAGIQALDAMVEKLARAEGTQPRLHVLVVKEPVANAFTAPGGRIVIFSTLIDAAESPEELAGVIAHEMGHAVHHHPTLAMVRALGLNLALKIFLGGTGDTAVTASAAGTLMQMHYNQRFEREADAEATRILYNAGVDNRGLIGFFRRLMAKEPASGKSTIFSYAASHPPTEERIATIQKARRARVTHPIVTDAQWQAIKHICD